MHIDRRIAALHPSWVVALLLVLAACATPRDRDVGNREEPDDLPTPAVQLSDYEDFDPAPYAESPPTEQADVQHDVPERLMSGRASSGTTTTMQGFRVQVYSTLDKAAAVELEEEARAWWEGAREEAPSSLSGNQLPIYTVYLQPYYRVRIGNFRNRAEAERARAYLARRFPDAFIVPDTVTITR